MTPMVRGIRAAFIAGGMAVISLPCGLAYADNVIANATPSTASSDAPAVNGLGITHSAQLTGNIYELAYDPQSNSVFVAVGGKRGEAATSGQIQQIDADSLKLQRTIVTPAANYGLVYSPRMQTLFSTDSRDGKVSAIRMGKELSSSTLTLVDKTKSAAGNQRPVQPREVVLDPDSDSVYVTGVGFGEEGNSIIWKLDGRTLTKQATFERIGRGVTGLAVSPDGKLLFATAMGSNQVITLDNQGKVLKRFSSGGEKPINIAYDAKGGRLFVANMGSDQLVVLDSQSGKSITSIATDKMPLGVRFDANNHRVYVASRQGGNVDVFDSNTYQRLARLPAPPMPNTVALDTVNDRAFVTSRGSNKPDAKAEDSHHMIYTISGR